MPAIDLLGRTGAEEFQIRYCGEQEPAVWIAAAKWHEVWEVGASTGALEAIFRLLAQVLDGGHCQHCNRPSGFEATIEANPLPGLICWYQWDPELETFRRGCEGDVPRGTSPDVVEAYLERGWSIDDAGEWHAPE
jgi:hypothetical protein